MFSYQFKPQDWDTKYLYDLCPVNPTSIPSIRESDKQEIFSICWIKNVTRQAFVT